MLSPPGDACNQPLLRGRFFYVFLKRFGAIAGVFIAWGAIDFVAFWVLLFR
jgi:hypothetical protein